jgi:hypothetical protein
LTFPQPLQYKRTLYNRLDVLPEGWNWEGLRATKGQPEFSGFLNQEENYAMGGSHRRVHTRQRG